MNFNECCYNLLRKVPKGKVTTYKSLAHAMNSKACRAVGNAMNKNPYAFCDRGRVGRPTSARKQSLLVPCHRVVKSNGEVGGFASGQEAKTRMLKGEGVEIVDGKIDLDKYGFNFN
ncbi:cysteine methyltransferase [Candidatus Pacearchaeota archaeon CG_4_9_14_0_2_um_filter_39_13]|nr:MGMT family protein [Candidatus Pacearchaeota archaeon]PJC45095.1 MAG: cysteine methyltransferase [Candidatus Pacearchaeota archaeon CG_4_9_14_0_2_um_filter_39_13]